MTDSRTGPAAPPTPATAATASPQGDVVEGGRGRTRRAGWRDRLRARSAARRPRPPVTGTPAAASSVALMLAIVSLWVFVQLLLLSDLKHEREQDLLYDQFRTDVALAEAPLGPIVPVGEPVALLQIPQIGLPDEVVVEGTASGDMLGGPGHQRNTVLPGQVGTSVVMGRAATYGAPFADLTDLVPGDTFDVITGQGTRTFTVLGVRRTGDPLPQPLEAGKARIVLATAEGEGSLGGLTPSEAVYVDAETDEGFPAPAGRPPVVPESEKVMAGEASVLPLLTLCLAALVGLTMLVIAARQRLSALLVWLIAAPVTLAMAWVTTDVAVRLLPNVM